MAPWEEALWFVCTLLNVACLMLAWVYAFDIIGQVRVVCVCVLYVSGASCVCLMLAWIYASEALILSGRCVGGRRLAAVGVQHWHASSGLHATCSACEALLL